MSIDFGWFPPTMGDTEVIGPLTREATTEYLVQVARADEALATRVHLVAAHAIALARATAV
jgi:hypothetical protein